MGFLQKVLAEEETFSLTFEKAHLPTVDADLAKYLGFNKEDDVELTKLYSLKWKYSFEARQYGVKSVDITIPDQEVTIEGTVNDALFDKKIKLKNVKKEIKKIDSNSISLFPTEIEFYKNEWIVIFQV
jgi:hypothetical protein